MTWSLRYLPDATEDILALDRRQRLAVEKAIQKVQQNPLPPNEGGYGKPLGKKHSRNLTNCLKIKLLREGLRIIYRLERTETRMLIVVVGVRADEKVYDIAVSRIKKYNL